MRIRFKTDPHINLKDRDMKKSMQKISIIVLIVTSLSATITEFLHSQTNASLSWYLIRDDNAFKSRNEYDELINMASLLISRTYTSDNFAIQGFYGADISAFSNYSDQQNHTHQFSVLSRFISGNFVANLGISAQVRRNDAQYIYYNTNAFGFYMRMQYDSDINKLYYFGLDFLKNEFTEFADLNNTTYRFYGKFQRFFENRLSVSGELGLGVKNYMNQSIYENYGFSNFMGMVRYKEEPVNAVQLSGYVSIGKSITSKTGLNVKLGGSRYAGEPIESFSDGIYYYTENDLYDDPYSYENQYVSATMTRQFGLGFQGKLGAVLNDKNYSGTPALSETGDLTGEKRADLRQEYSLLLSKSFSMNWKKDFSLKLYFRFLMRHNESNDPYYDFTDHLGIFGVTVSK